MSTQDKLAEALVFLDHVHRGLISGRISEWPGLREACGVVYAAYAAEAAQAQAQSGEWVMVPKEPTERMLQAAEDAVNAAAHCESTTDDLSAIAYKAALAAAPQQAAEPVAQVEDHFGYPLIEWIGDAGDKCPIGTKFYTHPQPAQDAKESGR